MATFRSRFPAKQEIGLVFAVCVFPIHVWSIYRLLYEVPTWVLHLTLWDMIGAAAYIQAFALLESVALLLFLVLLSILLPARFFRDRFVAQSCIIVFVTLVWVVPIHLGLVWVWDWQPKTLLWPLVYVLLLGWSLARLYASKRLENRIHALAERLTLLSSIYVALSLLSIGIIIFRNIARTLA